MPLGPPSPGINRAPIARMKMILIPIETLKKIYYSKPSNHQNKVSEIGLQAEYFYK